MAVELWSKSGSSSSVVSTGGVVTVGTAATTVQNTMVGNISVTGSPTTTTVGNYQIITFTGSGSFTPTASGNVEMMMIGGGGAGGNSSTGYGVKFSPGGGAGGMIYYGSNTWEFRSGTALTLAGGTTYTVVIGNGGATNTSYPPAVNSLAGGNTTITGGTINLTAYGGQGGWSANIGPGAGSSYWTFAYTVSTSNAAPNQGYSGGIGMGATTPSTENVRPGGGGVGGIGLPGNHGYSNSDPLAWKYVGTGGAGFYTDISGVMTPYGGGGGGGNYNMYFSTSYSRGGSNIGGVGAGYSSSAGAGTVNTGSGGGGGGGQDYYIPAVAQPGGNGGSGVLILKVPIYNIDPSAINAIQQNSVALGNTATGGDSITYTGNYRVHTFTSSGTFTAQHTGYIQYTVVAGGGGGCSGYRGSVGGAVGGSGGGGGFLEYYQSDNEYGDFKGPRMTVTTGDVITVVIGSGGSAGSYGAASVSGPTLSGSGTSSYIYNTNTKQYIYTLGGGGGGAGTTGAGSNPPGTWGGAGANQGRPGGSGGGGAYVAPNETSGTDDLNTGGGGEAIGLPVQGYAGSNGSFSNCSGGGAGGVGTTTGGPGRVTTITGSSVTYAAGGTRNASATGTNAAANTGNGGQGGNYQTVGQTNPGSNGGSGVVIIRYKFQ